MEVNYNHKNLIKGGSTCWWIQSFKYLCICESINKSFQSSLFNLILHSMYNYYVEEFDKIFVFVVLAEKYYTLMVYQYRRWTRRLILSTASELLLDIMQDYAALFGTGAFYCNECNHFLSGRWREFLHHYHTQCICICTWFQNHWLFI